MTTVLFPQRTDEQRLAALTKANEVRVDRAKMKRCLRDGSMSALETLDDPPDFAMSMKAYAFLCALPKLGRVKTLAIMARCQIAETKTVGGLSPRQRKALMNALYDRGIR